MSNISEVFNQYFPDADPVWSTSGIDVSGWQAPSVINDLWENGTRFDWAIIKVSEGSGYKSAEASQQIADCQRLGIPWGVYHFLSFEGVDEEIANLTEALAALPSPTISPLMSVTVWLDCEKGDFHTHVVPDGHDAYVQKLANAVRATGNTVGVYTASWWADGVLLDGSLPLWVSDYCDDKVWPGYANPALPAAWSNAHIWQYTSTSPQYGSLDLNVSVYDAAVTPGVPTPPPVTPPSAQVPELVRWLWLDDPMMEGDDVATMQQLLVYRGADPGPVDGIFGPLTDAGVRYFQETAGLAVDGIVGPLTWAALN